MTEQHPDFPYEQRHLDATLAAMAEIVQDLEQDMAARGHKKQKALSIKDEISAYVHALIRNDDATKKYNIEQAMASPYFGRVDFREDGTDGFHLYYIGRTKVTRLDIREVDDILVFDWRDPVSTIFYECHGGRAGYEVLGGRYSYTGDVRLKRQYKIEDGKLLAIADDDVLGKLLARQQESLIADPFLLERLLQGAGDRLKDIVTSIRSEQNAIIREPLNQVTVIQGVAGSGKSTIGLHRLSYLLYNEKLNPARLLVVAPNKIFLDYISELLPDIDAQDVTQLTFEDLAFAAMQLKPTVARREVDGLDEPGDSRKQRAKCLRWKGRPEFIQVLQAFVDRRVEKFCLKLEDIRLFGGELLITRQQQLDKVLEGVYSPYNSRLRNLEKYIRFRVNNHLEVLTARNKLGLQKSNEETLAAHARESEEFLRRHFAKWPYAGLIPCYVEVFQDKASWRQAKKQGLERDALAAHSLPVLAADQVEPEDLAPLCYLKLLLDGFVHMDKYDHIVVDEGQDLSLMEYIILLRLSSNSSFTVMGDMGQGIHSHRGLDSWQSLLGEAFGQAKSRYFEVNHSYRSAKEIVDLFNQVLPAGRSKAIPVYEIGRPPVIEKMASEAAGRQRLLAAVKEFQRLGCKSLGVLTRWEQDSCALYDGLKKDAPDLANLHLIAGDAARYHGGITVAPVALAKGLEFDAVVLWDASRECFSAEHQSAKLLYVALSRAMYYLLVLYRGEISPLLGQATIPGKAAHERA
ncbi:MAG TPA: UvrD-helicase domain-containing protein [Selenomonadales bacterium]|nr:UvrD-helicase domain-containing protein [Selenomonadales bacterium]